MYVLSVPPGGFVQGAFHSRGKAFEICSEQKDFRSFLKDAFLIQKDFAKDVGDFWGVKCPWILCISFMLEFAKRVSKLLRPKVAY